MFTIIVEFKKVQTDDGEFTQMKTYDFGYECTIRNYDKSLRAKRDKYGNYTLTYDPRKATLQFSSKNKPELRIFA